MPFCKFCGSPLASDEKGSSLCAHCQSTQAAPASAYPAEQAVRQHPRRRPLYIIPVALLFSLLMLLTVLHFLNAPEKRAEKMLNSFAKGYLTEDTDAALSIMPDCAINDLKREWGEDGYKELMHTSLIYAKAEYLDANYGENITVRFEDVKCREMRKSKRASLERHLQSLYHEAVSIKEAYYVSCTIHVSGTMLTKELPVDDRIALIKIGSKWSLFGTSPQMLAPDNQL